MLRAVLFDFDGVIADTEPIHFQLFQEILREEGLALTRQLYYERYLGYDDRMCLQTVYHDQGHRISERKLQELIALKTRQMKALLRRKRVLLPYAKRCIHLLGRRYPLAIISGALRDEIKIILRKEELLPYFPIIVAAEDVQKSKPHPQGFLKALKQLNANVFSANWPLKAAECLVIEDSHWGLQAARKAGMASLGVTTNYSKQQLREADLTLSGLKDITLRRLPQLERLVQGA